MSDFIFHDPSGRRARRAALLGGLLLSVIAAVVAAFFATLAFAPRLPVVHLKDPRTLSALHVETARKVKFHPTLTRVAQSFWSAGRPMQWPVLSLGTQS